MSSHAMGRTGIHLNMDAGDRVFAQAELDGRPVCKIEHTQTEPVSMRVPACTIGIESGSKLLRLSGEGKSAGKRIKKFDRAWRLHDLVVHTAALHDASRLLPDRIAAFALHLQDLETQYEGDFYNPLVVEEAGWNASTIDEAERRLGVKPPQALRDVYRERIDVGGSFFVEPGSLNTVSNVLAEEWSYNGRSGSTLDGILSVDSSHPAGMLMLCLENGVPQLSSRTYDYRYSQL